MAERKNIYEEIWEDDSGIFSTDICFYSDILLRITNCIPKSLR